MQQIAHTGTRYAGSTGPTLKLPDWQNLTRALLARIPLGSYIISVRTNGSGGPVYAARLTADSDVDRVWQDIRRAGAAGLDCIVTDDLCHFEILSGPVPEGRGCLSPWHVERRNALLNFLFAPSGRIDS